MGVKQSLKNVAGDLGTLSDQYRTMVSPYEETRGWMQKFRNDQLQPQFADVKNWRTSESPDTAAARGVYSGMISDPTKRGFDPETRKRMLGTQLDVLSGGRASERNQVRRAIAAGGMGATGAGIRAAMQSGERYAGGGRAAARDVELAQGQAEREDLWNATRGMMDIAAEERAKQTTGFGLEQANLGAQQNLYNQELAALAGQQGVYQGAGNILANKIPALGGAGNAGFWGNFSSIANSLGNLNPVRWQYGNP